MRTIVVKLFSAVASRYGQVLLKHRSVLVIGTQLSLILAANLTAFALRFDADVPPPYDRMVWRYLPAVLLIYGSGLWVFGIQRGLWRYVGLHDLGRIFWAALASSGAFYVIFHLLLRWAEYPRSIIIMTGLFTGMYLAGIRLAVRWFREWLQVWNPTARRVLVVGAGNAGELLIRDMQSDAESRYRPVGLVDDDPLKQRMRVHGVPVVGTIGDIPAVTSRLIVHEIIVALPSASTSVKQRILAASEGCKVPIKLLPNVKQLLSDPAALRQVRPMSLEDLLQREPVQMDRQELHPLLENKRVLVTGAGGSIGSELCRQIAHYKPACLVLFDRYENGLHALDLELRVRFPYLHLIAAVGDVTVRDRVSEVLRQTGPDLVFHAAAHKHVPLMELNPKEAVRNNVFGTKVVVEAALAAGVDRFVLISTDKAVNPTSVMGATKRIAEELIRNLSETGRTRCSVVRFGNVLGSSGSVVPLFAEQIRLGGPVTVTHPDIKRFFMTIPEAVQLVLQASVLGQGGDVFVLDMGEQIRVADLARNMIVLSGLVPDRDIHIAYTGLRPGEKLYEELFEEAEQVEPTEYSKIRRAVKSARIGSDRLARSLRDLEETLNHGDDEELTRRLSEAVPTYAPLSSAQAKAPTRQPV